MTTRNDSHTLDLWGMVQRKALAMGVKVIRCLTSSGFMVCEPGKGMPRDRMVYYSQDLDWIDAFLTGFEKILNEDKP